MDSLRDTEVAYAVLNQKLTVNLIYKCSLNAVV